MEIGDVKIEFLGHSGFLISHGDKKIAVDPYNVSDGVDKADFILITHGHYDHCSIKDISRLSKNGTVIVCTPDVQSKITKVDGVNMQIVELGDELEFDGLKIATFPAYNIGKDFHPKSEQWLGYIIKMHEVTIYHSGDSDIIPEMEKLTGYGKHGTQFVALLPVSGTYVMNAEEAAEVALMIKPDLAIPMHYGAGVAGTREDAEKFMRLCREEGIRAEILEKV